RRVNKYTSEKITTGILPDPSNPLTVTYTAGHRRGTEVFGTHRRKRTRTGQGNWRLIRYADDFVLMVSGDRHHAEALR
ncbi:MAG: hypothetical protein M3460_30170, partial [Actinomycetota bacterium]|nr:hypothetical protein [Actinomycetota bacterium]